MKSWIILIVLAVTLTAAFTVAMPLLSSDMNKELSFPAPAKPDGPAPVAEVVEPLLFDFGTLPQQYKGHHSWTFRNTGLGPLELRGAGTTCSCTTATLFSDKKEAKQIVIAPGESLPIDVTFDTKNWNQFRQTVTVGTNDPSRPTILLTLEGVVNPAILTVPADPSISFGAVGNEMENTRRIALFSPDRPDVKLTKVTSTNPTLIVVTARPMGPDELKTLSTESSKPGNIEKGYAIEVTLKPTGNLGAFNEEVLIETDHPQKSEMRFKVVGKVTGPIIVVPERVTVRGATAVNGGLDIHKIVVRGRTSVNFTVDKKPKDLEVSIEPMAQAPGAKGSMYKMVVKVTPGAESGRMVDEIVLKTDDPSASEVKIPVDVLVQGTK